MSGSIDILGLGCAAVDDIIHVGHYPVPDFKTAILERDRRCGGLTAGALIAAAHLGARCSYAGCLGENDPSSFVRQSLAKHGVQINHVKQIATASPITSVIVVDRSSGSRNIFFDVSGLVELEPGWPGEDVLRAARVLFVDHFNIKAQIWAAKAARRAGIPVVADFESATDDNFPTLLSLTDHLILSHEFAEHLTGCPEPLEAVRALWHPGLVAAVVTCGSKGCWFATRVAHNSATSREFVVSTNRRFPFMQSILRDAATYSMALIPPH